MVKMDYRKIKKALETLSDMCDEITRDSYAEQSVYGLSVWKSQRGLHDSPRYP